MKQVDEMPTSGQFVAVWSPRESQISEQSINCKKFQWLGGNLKECMSDMMLAVDSSNKMKQILDSTNATYFVID